MPLQTECLAVINEIGGGDPTIKRPDQVKQYARQISAAHRDIYADDDETAVTLAWLVSIGGTDADPDATFAFGEADALTLSLVGDTGVASILATDPAATEIGTYATRGEVRRLLSQLGITYTGTQSAP